MTTSDARVWIPRSATCNQSPFRTGIDLALANAFPPVIGTESPGRIEAVLGRLERALQIYDRRAYDGAAAGSTHIP